MKKVALGLDLLKEPSWKRLKSYRLGLLSNQASLGRDEVKVIENLESVVMGVLMYERKARRHIISSNRAQVEDRLFRALGMLRTARLLTSQEMMHLLSAVRLAPP